MSKESDKIINSLFKTVLDHLNDGIRNVIENSEITREITHNEATGTDSYSFHVNFGGKTVINGKVDDILGDFVIHDGILSAYRGKDDEVTVPDGVVEIGSNAFAGKLIKKMVLPDSVIVIGERAFYDCFVLENIQFGNGLKSVGISAFEGCSELSEAILPDSVEVIGNRAFAENWSLEHVHLPSNLIHLSDELFCGCRILDIIDWPQNLQTHGHDIFNDCFEPDIWGYYSIEDGQCERITADREELDPEGLFILNKSYYSQAQANKLLNWIWKDAAFDMSCVDEKMEISRFVMKFIAILTNCDIYAAMMAAVVCLNYLQSNEKTLYESSDYCAMINQVLDVTCGNGENWRQTDKQIHDSILDCEDPDDASVQEMADKCFVSMMNELETDLTPNRYHPSIYHYGTRYCEDESYWKFVIGLEGLLRFNGYNIMQCEVLCDPDDTLDDWLCSWSKVLETADFALVNIIFGEESHCFHWILLISPAQAAILHGMLEDKGCSEIMSGWQIGKKLFALTMI